MLKKGGTQKVFNLDVQIKRRAKRLKPSPRLFHLFID